MLKLPLALHHQIGLWFLAGCLLGGFVQHERDRFQMGYYARLNETSGRYAARLLKALEECQQTLEEGQ